jgi:pimeloyl-ACP methyl ester carboxylesterase
VNVGRSDRVNGRHTGADSVRDLHALLAAAGVQGPYLMVGFSW